MNVDDWKLQMQHLLEFFERESTIWLRKINHNFAAMGRPFDEQFRQYFLKMSALRLNTSFTMVQFERYNEKYMQSALNSSASNHGNEIHIGSNVSSSAEHSVDEQNVPRHGNLSGMMTKNSVCVSTEIADSNVENGGADSEMQTENDTNGDRMELNAPLNTECGNDKPDNEHDGIDLSTENGVAVRVKLEPKVENEIETGVMDLPVITFDPIEYNARQTSVGSRTRRSKLTGNQIQPNSSTTVQKQRNRYAAKLSKSKANAYDSHREPFGNQHQQIRDHQKSITPIKNVQTLFDCGRCMRLFSQEMEKTEHESRCRKQRYECHRCNKFVTVNKSSMLKHDQSHCT